MHTPSPQTSSPNATGQRDFLSKTLERLRAKLLDLTARNPLVSFKHNGRSKRLVRIIDELPDQLFDRLGSDSGMRFRSLGDQSDVPEDEQTIVFRRALDAAKLEDPEYLSAVAALGDEQSDRAMCQLEESLRLRLRERIGMPDRRASKGLSSDEAARRMGLDPSFELPLIASESGSRHSDASIQTSLFEEPMQLTLAKIRDQVRLSIDEAGVNPLFCAFGFLEWYEDDNSSVSMYAPVLLLPLEMDRHLVRGQYQYSVKATGEGATSNHALFERLKRDFGIELPPFGEEDTPEGYFARVQRTIENRKNWKLRRWVTVGLFSFARISMYKDLLPEQWTGDGLLGHPALQTLMVGGGDGSLPPAGTTSAHEDDAPDVRLHAAEVDVPLISDTDSSQLAAITDVLAGKNLIIEGPPGTGKSQTITNIIAAAIAAGKTVLFVAEKRAALQVVEQRLRAAGLEDFCLELHSSKAGRKEVSESLSKRVLRKKAPNVDAQVAATLSNLNESRKQLRSLVDALASPITTLGMSTQSLLWRYQAIREQTKDLPSGIDEHGHPLAATFTEVDIDRVCSVARQFADIRQLIVDTFGSPAKHPWRGVAVHSLSVIEIDDLVRVVGQLSECAAAADSLLQSIEASVGFRWTNMDQVNSLSRGAELVPFEGPEELLIAMADVHVFAGLEQFLKDSDEYASSVNSIQSAFTDIGSVTSATTDQIQRLLQAVRSAGLGETSVKDVPTIGERRRHETDAWSEVNACVQTAKSAVGLNIDCGPDAEYALVRSIELAVRAHEEVVRNRTASLVAPGARDGLKSIESRLHDLKTRCAALSERFVFHGLPTSSAIRLHASAVRAAPGLPFLSGKWWKARKFARSVSKTPKLGGRLSLAASLDELASYIDDLEKFSADPQVREILGSHLNGLETMIKPAMAVADWAESVRGSITGQGSHVSLLVKFLFEATPVDLSRLAAIGDTRRFRDLQRIYKNGSPVPARAIADQLQSVIGKRDACEEAMRLISSLGLASDFSLSRVTEVQTALGQIRSLGDSLDNNALARRALGVLFAGRSTSTTAVREALSYVRLLYQVGLPNQAREWILRGSPAERTKALAQFAQRCRSILEEWNRRLSELQGITRVDFQAWLGTTCVNAADLAGICAHSRLCASDPSSLQLLVDDLRLHEEVKNEGVATIADWLERSAVPIRCLPDACRRVIYGSLVRQSIAAHPSLANFTRERHEGFRSRFRELDRQLLQQRQNQIASTLASRNVRTGNGMGPRSAWTGLPLIQNEIGKQKRHIPIRDLLDRAGTEIQQLKPCFLMSPLSVAQYLKPGGLKFDIVVMDEASQLRPEDAVGAVVRGGQVVIVGDPKQLPPTNFFMDGGELSDDETPDTAADEESILDVGLSVTPVRRLKWHYRSRHASLIAFSNREFYGNELVTFPSPYHEHPEFGVRYVKVEGCYEAGINPPEVTAVAAAVLEHATRHPDRSLGVVTLNKKQCELLKLELDRIATTRPEFEAWRERWEATLEPFFVKNLENVQGDERDVIFISTVYGKTATGAFMQRFGPINSKGGHRRLNVLFTRAKCQTVVFTSIDPGDIVADESSAWGVRALKGFLQFAKGGSMDVALPTDRAPDSDFEIAVSRVLQEAGFQVVPQVGVVGYFIDLAVRHPVRKGEFAIGIECDGATYHSSKLARDRDRLRQDVLERLDWRIHRIWSLDWYRNNRRESERLLSAVRQAIG